MLLACKRAGVVAILICMLQLPMSGSAQTNYAVHANIIYRFTRYIDWPSGKKSGDFIIGVVGDSPLYDELNNFISKKTAGSQRIVIKRFPASANTFECHILFISENQSTSTKKIAQRTERTPVLLVTEGSGLAYRGACINFIIVDDHLKLEINKNNIENRSLHIASELVQLGTIIR